MFGRIKKIDFDRQTQEPAIRKSICTGETTVGFVDLKTGHFSDYMNVTDSAQIDDFCRRTGTEREHIRTVY